MKGQVYQAKDRRWMVSVKFQRESPTDNQPTIECIFHLHWPDDFTVKGDPYVLVPVSRTRTDTREPATISRAEETEILTRAMVIASNHHAHLSEPDDG